MREVCRHGSQEWNASESRDSRKDIVRGHRLEREKAQEHEQPDSGGNSDGWVHVHHEFMEDVRSHGGCSNKRQYYEYESDDSMKMESQLEDMELNVITRQLLMFVRSRPGFKVVLESRIRLVSATGRDGIGGFEP